MSKYYLIFIISIFTLMSCGKQDEFDYYYIYYIEECLDREILSICVSKKEHERIKKISMANEEGENVNCLIIEITDLDGNVQEKIFRGYGSSNDDFLCK